MNKFNYNINDIFVIFQVEYFFGGNHYLENI